MNITVVGAGYVGLVTGACLAEVGNRVTCVDNDAGKIAALRAGRPPFYEPGLAELLAKTIAAGRLEFTCDLAAGVAHAAVIFIAVGTPPAADGGADLRHVLAVAEAIGARIGAGPGDYCVVVNKSTAPVGSAQRIGEAIFAAIKSRGWRSPAGDRDGDGGDDGGGGDPPAPFAVVANPEFLKQGAAIDDFMKPERIILGAAPDDARALTVMRELYAPFNRNHERVIAMDLASAELTKYAANAMLATRISTMNEIANLAAAVGADIEAVRLGVGADPRIGYAYIYPGCGYGGSCLPKDLRALRRAALEAGVEARVLTAVDAVNAAQKRAPVARLVAHFGGAGAGDGEGDGDGAGDGAGAGAGLAGKTIALWGLAFKPDTDDMRAAPSRQVLEDLWARAAVVRAFDPVAAAQARRLYPAQIAAGALTLCDEPFAALRGAAGLVVVTEWRMLRALDPARIAAEMAGDIVVDGRNMFDPGAFRAAGLTYYGVGRG